MSCFINQMLDRLWIEAYVVQQWFTGPLTICSLRYTIREDVPLLSRYWSRLAIIHGRSIVRLSLPLGGRLRAGGDVAVSVGWPVHSRGLGKPLLLNAEQNRHWGY
jgi:hypothetical protein